MRRLLLLASGVVFTESIFFTALAPLLPHYSETLSLSKPAAGFLVCSYAAGSLAGALPSGVVASRLGAKATAITGLILLSSLSVVFAFAGVIWLLDLARFGQGVGAALAWTGALTWLIARTPANRRGEVIGIATGAAATGALLGPAVGGAASVLGARTTFTGVACLTTILIIGCWRTSDPQPRTAPRLRTLFDAVRQRRGITTGIWLMALPSLGLGAIEVLVPLRLGRLGLSGVQIGAVFLFAAALQAVASLAVGRWADASGRRTPLVAALALSLVFTTGLALGGTDATSLSILAVGTATALGAFYAPAIAWLTDEADAAGLEPGLGLALLNLAWSPGQMLGAAASGATAAAIGDAATYLLLAPAEVLTLVVLTSRARRRADRVSAPYP